MATLPDFEEFAIKVEKGVLKVLDQTKLPNEEIWLTVNTIEDMWQNIKRLSVRGAPMIGCCAAMVLALQATKMHPKEADIEKHAAYLKTSRPTAVNLMYACDIVAQVTEEKKDFSSANIIKLAYDLKESEKEMNARMSKFGAALVNKGDNILTHCNTGSLATPGMGTALGVIREAHRQKKEIHVYVDETRPLLQGGRLTAYELKREGIPYTIITDNMAGMLMAQGKVDRIFVGSDRIALNGDFANKIGTYSVAVLANYHKVPFHPVAPASTIDFECTTGADIPIEQRKPEEVRGAFGTTWAPTDAKTYNPAFDVTPIALVESIVLDSGVHTKEMIEGGSLKKLAPK